LQTKNLSREALLTSFLQRACDISSSGLQICTDGYLYASGEMIAAWREAVLFIDFGSDKVCNRRAANDLKELAEKEGVVYVPYNTHSYVISHEFQFAERMVSYTIWATPKDVNPKNIFAQALKVLDKAVEKAISFGSIQKLITDTQHIASLFSFEFDASRYTTQLTQLATQGALNARIAKEQLAQYHLETYYRLKQELEAS
jgi:hypothetical protein